MEEAGTVDPEIQATISNLVSALGGLDSSGHKYKLGDEALECLRDLRKWLQNYDSKHDRLEVACAIAHTSLVTSDIPAILGMWETTLRKKNDPYLDRIALACLELLVPLTWPIDILGKEASVDHFGQIMFLKNSQKIYKEKLVLHKSHGLFKTVIRMAAPSLKVAYKDREPRDEGILTLVCSFFRNILAITGDHQDRALAVEEFQRQKVLDFILTLAAGLGSSLSAQFDAQDTLVAECVYHLLKGIDVARLYGLDSQDVTISDVFNQNLKGLLERETNEVLGSQKPSRHSRFGTLIAMREDDGRSQPITSQRGLSGDLSAALALIDQKKKWHAPRLREAADETEKMSYMPSAATINGSAEALKSLRQFTNEFLDSSYNPLFLKIRKLIERQQSPRVATPQPLVHFCYLTGWFIAAERCRAQSEGRAMDFKLVGVSLSKPSFSIVMSLIRRGLEPGDLRSTDLVHAAMFSFRHILTTIRDMSYSENAQFRDAGEGMKSRLFYEDTWLQCLASLPRSSHRKSLAYTCETIRVTHIILKMLGEYAKQHSLMFVRGRQQRKSRLSGATDEDGSGGSETITNERRFSFDKFVLKYINAPTIEAYERVLANFNDVSEEVVLQVFAFLRQTYAKSSCKALFYRLSFMQILTYLIRPNGLPEKCKAREVASKFVKFYVKNFCQTAREMPSLHIAVNETLLHDDMFYYDHGGQSKEKFRRPKHELELSRRAVKEFSPEKQMAVIVAALIDSGKESELRWIQREFGKFIEESSEASDSQQRLFTEDREQLKTVHNDALLRLMLRSLGLLVNMSVGQIRIPGSLDKLQLIEQLQWINKYQSQPVEFPDNRVAMDFIRIEGQDNSDDDLDEDAAAADRGLRPRAASSGAIADQGLDPTSDSHADPHADMHADTLAGDLFVEQASPVSPPKRTRPGDEVDVASADDEVVRPYKRHHAISDDDDDSN